MKLIHALVDTLPPGEACFWEDEADVDLNPRVGADWTLPGEERTVSTPGQNVERYFAAMEVPADRLVQPSNLKRAAYAWQQYRHSAQIPDPGVRRRRL